MWDALWIDVHLATMDSATGLGEIEDGALAVADGRIVWVGRRIDLPGVPEALAQTVHKERGRWITPGLIDCHTHLVHGGDRAREFAMRAAGARYEDIARVGGGILSTVRATRAASEAELVAAARPRLDALRAEGVTTIEIKSGYGLDTETECKMLRAAARLGKETGVRVRRTFLGAHAVAEAYSSESDLYIDLVCGEMLPRVAAERLADAVDAFGERIAFSPAQVTRVFEAAAKAGLPVKLHADQLSDQGGAALAAAHSALSADHLEYAAADGIRAMADTGTVAVLLPAAFYVLGETRKPPVDIFRRFGVPMAVSTDCNPGSAPVTSLLLMLNMACTLFGLRPDEALAGVTRHAAAALGLAETCGRLKPGLAADFVIWDINDPVALSYRIGFNPAVRVVVGGTPLEPDGLAHGGG